MEHRDAAACLAAASEVMTGRGTRCDDGALLGVGVDLGTANLVITVVDSEGWPVAGTTRAASVVRDGLVVDYIGAVDLLREMKAEVEDSLGRSLGCAATAYPPGVAPEEVRATVNVLQAAGFECSGVIDEPSAAGAALGVTDGVVVDVGGGTTGVSVLRDGEVCYAADEPTGGHHLTLVIAGALGISYEEAEDLKKDPAQSTRLLPVVRPVMEKVGTIVRRHVADLSSGTVFLAGGTCCFPGIDGVVAGITGLDVELPGHPLFVTPLGIALRDLEVQTRKVAHMTASAIGGDHGV
ncbi:MAG: ethanolamine utilization protein EutJ [Actinobacteria bacterium]|nr:ethanolamine utilization protein EutJ [Actinomycetota bacterium]